MNKNSKIHPSCLNIEGERVEYKDDSRPSAGNRTATFGDEEKISGGNGSGGFEASDTGRFPSQLLISPEAAVILDEQTGMLKSGDGKSGKIMIKHNKSNFAVGNEYDSKGIGNTINYGDTGGGSKILHQVWFSDYEIYEIENNFEMYKNK